MLTTKKYDAAIQMSDNCHQNGIDPLRQYVEPTSLPGTLKQHEVNKDCELQEFVTSTLKTKFKRGHAYYEFTSEIENIQEGKEILLQDKQNSEEWFRFKEVLSEEGKLYGEGIARNKFGQRYRVFIQSFGSGARHLPGGSSILYNYGDQVN